MCKQPVDGVCACSAWAWTLWEAAIPIQGADRSQPLEIAVRAVDGSYNTQPEVRLPGFVPSRSVSR